MVLVLYTYAVPADCCFFPGVPVAASYCDLGWCSLVGEIIASFEIVKVDVSHSFEETLDFIAAWQDSWIRKL